VVGVAAGKGWGAGICGCLSPSGPLGQSGAYVGDRLGLADPGWQGFTPHWIVAAKGSLQPLGSGSCALMGFWPGGPLPSRTSGFTHWVDRLLVGVDPQARTTRVAARPRSCGASKRWSQPWLRRQLLLVGSSTADTRACDLCPAAIWGFDQFREGGDRLLYLFGDFPGCVRRPTPRVRGSGRSASAGCALLSAASRQRPPRLDSSGGLASGFGTVFATAGGHAFVSRFLLMPGASDSEVSTEVCSAVGDVSGVSGAGRCARKGLGGWMVPGAVLGVCCGGFGRIFSGLQGVGVGQLVELRLWRGGDGWGCRFWAGGRGIVPWQDSRTGRRDGGLSSPMWSGVGGCL